MRLFMAMPRFMRLPSSANIDACFFIDIERASGCARAARSAPAQRCFIRRCSAIDATRFRCRHAPCASAAVARALRARASCSLRLRCRRVATAHARSITMRHALICLRERERRAAWPVAPRREKVRSGGNVPAQKYARAQQARAMLCSVGCCERVARRDEVGNVECEYDSTRRVRARRAARSYGAETMRALMRVRGFMNVCARDARRARRVESRCCARHGAQRMLR